MISRTLKKRIKCSFNEERDALELKKLKSEEDGDEHLEEICTSLHLDDPTRSCHGQPQQHSFQNLEWMDDLVCTHILHFLSPRRIVLQCRLVCKQWLCCSKRMYHSVRNIQDETKFNFTRNFIKLGYKIVDLEFSYLTTMEMKDWSDLFQSLSKQHSELTRLTIANCKISDSCLYDIFSEKNVNTFQQLKYLDLQGNLISQSAAFTISQPFVTQLNYLNISMNVNIGDEGIHEFVKSGVLNNLQSFILQRTQCTAQGVKSVTLLNQLTHLDLSKNSIQAEGISNLVQNITLCQNLKVLKLCHCGLRVAGMNTLISAEVHFKNLRHLDLEWNRLEEEGIQTLCSSSLLKQVTYLNLKLNGVNDRAAQCIADSPHLQQLTALNLAQNHISHVGALALLTSTTLRPTLRMLNLNLNNVHDEHLKKTLQQEPNYEILKTGLNLLE